MLKIENKRATKGVGNVALNMSAARNLKYRDKIIISFDFKLYLGEQDWERLVSRSRDLTLSTT